MSGLHFDADREVMALSKCSEGQMHDSGETTTNPVFCVMPTPSRPPPGRPGLAAARTGPSPETGPRGWCGGPPRTRTTRAWVRGAGRVGGEGSHAGHDPSVVASGWGSLVSETSAAAASARLART